VTVRLNRDNTRRIRNAAHLTNYGLRNVVARLVNSGVMSEVLEKERQGGEAAVSYRLNLPDPHVALS
jgi:hypothetical protein